MLPLSSLSIPGGSGAPPPPKNYTDVCEGEHTATATSPTQRQGGTKEEDLNGGRCATTLLLYHYVVISSLNINMF